MHYTMKAHPTRYKGVQFRSRLEARWAAFFDLCGLQWEYEPIDFDGWSPDFSIETPYCKVFVEVKPWDDAYGFDPAVCERLCPYSEKVQLMLLGVNPTVATLGEPPEGAKYSDDELFRFFPREFFAIPIWPPGKGKDPSPKTTQLWREAGNRTQWKPA